MAIVSSFLGSRARRNVPDGTILAHNHPMRFDVRPRHDPVLPRTAFVGVYRPTILRSRVLGPLWREGGKSSTSRRPRPPPSPRRPATAPPPPAGVCAVAAAGAEQLDLSMDDRFPLRVACGGTGADASVATLPTRKKYYPINPNLLVSVASFVRQNALLTPHPSCHFFWACCSRKWSRLSLMASRSTGPTRSTLRVTPVLPLLLPGSEIHGNANAGGGRRAGKTTG